MNCCKSCLLCFSLFFVVLLSPVLLQAQSVTKTVATNESTTVKAEAVALDLAFGEGEVQKTTKTKCSTKTSDCPPNCKPVCPPNCPPAQCKPSACKTTAASSVPAKPNAATKEM